MEWVYDSSMDNSAKCRLCDRVVLTELFTKLENGQELCNRCIVFAKIDLIKKKQHKEFELEDYLDVKLVVKELTGEPDGIF